jgi:thiamine-phosphate pyrophosphorylase
MLIRSADERRLALGRARLMLLFTPELCGDTDPDEKLASLLPHVDVVQLRIKPVATQTTTPGSASSLAPARQTYDWTLRTLELCEQLEQAPLVIVDDRVDVALALRDRGVDGVHLGRCDFPGLRARDLVGEDLLIGLSTHDVSQVAMAEDQGADYVGFGPIFATQTKGYTRAIGPEAAWIASIGCSLPVFPIGGIDTENINTLTEVGRAAISSALLNSSNPKATAEALRNALEE